MAFNCDLLFSYSHRYGYIGDFNYKNTITMSFERVFAAEGSTPLSPQGVPPLITGKFTGVIINGHNFGTGRIISFSNPTSTEITENGKHLWKQRVNIEVYEQGDTGNFPTNTQFNGASIFYSDRLESLEESFNFDITENGDYQYTHTATAKCIDKPGSGLDGFVEDVSGYTLAAIIVNDLLDTTPPFGLIDINHSGLYGALGRRIYSESLDKINGSATFTERFTIQQRDFVKHNFTFENGYINVSESATIRHSGVSTASGVLKNNEYQLNTRYSDLVDGALIRCSGLAATYGSLLGSDAYTNYLHAQPTQRTKTFDERSQELTYNVVYTNNANMQNGYTIEREQGITQSSNGIDEITENGTLSLFINKSATGSGLLISGINNEISTFISRMTPYYANIATAKKSSETKMFSSLGKNGSYQLTYTSNPAFVNNGGILIKNINLQDALPIVMHSPYVIIGQNTPLVHRAQQVDFGTITCSINANLARPAGYYPDKGYYPYEQLNTIFLEAVNAALNSISIKTPTDFYVDKVAYAYDSKLNLKVDIGIKYLYPRTDIL